MAEIHTAEEHLMQCTNCGSNSRLTIIIKSIKNHMLIAVTFYHSLCEVCIYRHLKAYVEDQSSVRVF